MPMRSVPCIILGYSRIDSLINLINQADRIGFNPIYVSIDGPSNGDIARIQERMILQISALSKVTKSQIIAKFREENLGVAAGIISGIDWFFKNETYGAVLEDDLELSDDFLRYVEFAEKILKKDQACLLASGCRFSSPDNRIAYTTYPLIWGWATSRLNWDKMRAGLLEKPKCVISFNARRNYWMVGSRRVHDGLIDTWDTPLASFMIENNFYCLIPPVNLTTNIGYDKHAAHTKSFSFPLGLPNGPLGDIDLESLQIQKDVEVENQFMDAHVYFIGLRHRFLSVFYWLVKPFFNPKYMKLRSRILDI